MNFLKATIRGMRTRWKEINFPYRPYHRRHMSLFIHVPKTAGTSILIALGQHSIGGRDHLPWYVYFTANPEYFKSCFKFAFVRNPWARTLSAYQYLRAGGNQNGDMQIMEQLLVYKDFGDFVVRGLGEGYFRNHLLFVPQSHFVATGTGEVVVDFLGRYERLHEDYRQIANVLHLPDSLPLENASSGPKTSYHDSYGSSAAIEIVGEIYKQDIRLFGYSF